MAQFFPRLDEPLKAFIAERNPKKIALNMSEEVGAADGLSKTSYDRLV